MKIKAALILSLLLAGCTTATEPHTPVDFGMVISGDSQQFQSVKTFAWHARSGTVLVKDKEQAQKASQFFHSVVEQQLIEKGYRLVSQPIDADVLFAIALAQQSEMPDTDIFAKTLLSTGIVATDAGGDMVEKGTLYVAAYLTNSDQQDLSGQPIWKALAQRPMGSDVEDETAQASATGLVKRMMNSIPVSNN